MSRWFGLSLSPALMTSRRPKAVQEGRRSCYGCSCSLMTVKGCRPRFLCEAGTAEGRHPDQVRFRSSEETRGGTAFFPPNSAGPGGLRSKVERRNESGVFQVGGHVRGRSSSLGGQVRIRSGPGPVQVRFRSGSGLFQVRPGSDPTSTRFRPGIDPESTRFRPDPDPTAPTG